MSHITRCLKGFETIINGAKGETRTLTPCGAGT